MKKFVTYLLFFFVLFGSISPILTAHAQQFDLNIPDPVDPARFAPSGDFGNTSPTKLKSNTRPVNLNTPDSSRATAAVQSSQEGSISSSENSGSLNTPEDEIDGATGKRTSQEIPPKPLFSCGFGKDMFNECMAAAGVSMIDISGTALYISGVFLNTVLQYTVVESNKLYNNLGVKNAWETLRDLANIFFIFILLAIGLVTILQVSTWNYKTLLRDLIIMALVVNFSFFATGVVIDVSNIAALELYEKLEITDDCTTNATTAGGKVKCLNGGFTGAFMSQLRLSSIFDTDKFEEIQKSKPESFYLDILLIGVFGSLFILITSFVLLATAFMLLIRVIVLIILLIISPIAFAAFVLPSTRRYFKQWIQKLFTNAFFAPIYLLSILLSLNVMKEIGSDSGSPSFVEALLSGNTSKADIFLNFAIITGFMIASLIIAKQVGAYGGTRIADTGNKWRKGLQGAFGRQTVGRLGAGISSVGRVAKTVPIVSKLVGAPLTAIGGYASGAKFGSDKTYQQAKTDAERKKMAEADALKGDISGLVDTIPNKKARERLAAVPDLAKRRYGKTILGLPTTAGKKAKKEIVTGAEKGIVKTLTESANKQSQELARTIQASLSAAISEAANDNDSGTLNSMASVLVNDPNTNDDVKEEISKLVRIGKRDLQQEKALGKLIQENVGTVENAEKMVPALKERSENLKGATQLNQNPLVQASGPLGLNRSYKKGIHTAKQANTLQKNLNKLKNSTTEGQGAQEAEFSDAQLEQLRKMQGDNS